MGAHSFYILKKESAVMSEPRAPYYYDKESDTYHWELSCSKNHYGEKGAENWEKTVTRPTGREQCNECKAK